MKNLDFYVNYLKIHKSLNYYPIELSFYTS